MTDSPMRFQLAVAVLAIGGATLMTSGDAAEPDPVFTFQDPAIEESSGLVDLGDTVLTVNDSGDGPVVYVVDETSGQTVGRTTYTTEEVVDVEAMAPGVDGSVWVGDIGDNPWSRVSVSVYEIPEIQRGEITVEAQRYDLVYEDGPRDAEALLIHPETGQLYVVSKGLLSGQVYAAPPRLSTETVNVLRPVGEVRGMVTDGAFFPDGRHVALRTYGRLVVLEAYDFKTVEGMPLPSQQQGEGLAVRASGEGVLVSTEGVGTPVLEIQLTEEIRDATDPTAIQAPNAASSDHTPTPAASVLETRRERRTWALAVGGSAVGLLVLVWWLLRRQRRSTT